MNRFYKAFMALLICATAFVSCIKDGDDTIILESGNNTGIPSDNIADENPIIDNSTTTIPNIQYTVEEEGKDAVVHIDMTGVKYADSYDWLRLLGTGESGQNVWLSIDGQPKGIAVYNNADDNEEEKKLSCDLVFLVDNSGSMGDEADAIARDIIDWANKLTASNLDISFACVGYGFSYGKVYGAINLTDVNTLATYLERSYGIYRTVGFYGEDELTLSTAANHYSASGECGGLALRYADENLSFRPGANRIYVNFTDEPNQPGGNNRYSTESFKTQEYWNTNQGTVHTVYSSDTINFYETMYYQEKPWRISEYTGGTIITAPSNFQDVTLESLPITGAMTNSYVIRFTNVSEFMDGKPHYVKITILSEDGKTRAERTFNITFTKK